MNKRDQQSGARPPRRGIKIYEDTAIICERDEEMTLLLSVIMEQTDTLVETGASVPWITKTHRELDFDTMRTIKHPQAVLEKLVAKNFLELAQNGPKYYQYRLNANVVQAAIDALLEATDEWQEENSISIE